MSYVWLSGICTLTTVHLPKATPQGLTRGSASLPPPGAHTSERQLGHWVWLPAERAHLLSAAEVFGSILNIQSRSVTSEWEDTSLASWSGLREAYSSGTLVLQLVTCNLESFFSSFQIWVFLYTVLQFSVPFALSVTLSSHGSQYPST